MKEEGSGGELGSDLDLDPDPDPQKILWIRIQQNYADRLDPDPQHWLKGLLAWKASGQKVRPC